MTKFKVLTDRLNTFFTNNKITTGNSIPTSGEWNVGDICISSIQENGECGWICTESGTPGKWEIFGSGGSGKLVSLTSSVEVTGPVTEVSLTGLGTNVSENDKLFVHYNSTHLLEGVDFEIISNGIKIRKLGGGSWNESSSNAMFAFELLKHVKKVNGDNILLDSKMCVLKSNKTISAPTSEVEIGIEGFNKDSDYLTVYVNSTYLTEGVDYNISSDSRKIVSLNGNWNEESLSEYRFSFVVIKEVGIVNPEAVVGTENLKDSSVTMGKLGEDVIERLDGFDSQLEQFVINVKNFGAKGDGVSDDTQAIQDSINHVFEKGGGEVLFPKGIYSIKGSGSLELKSNVDLRGVNGVIIDFSQRDKFSSEEYKFLVNACGNISSQKLLTFDALKGSYTIKCDTSTLNEGDLICITSNKQYTETNSSIYVNAGELSIVNHVINSNEIQLNSMLNDDYLTTENARIYKVTPIENVKISGLTFKGKGRNTNPTLDADYGVGFTYCKDVIVENCKFEDIDTKQLEFRSCYNFIADNNIYNHSKYTTTDSGGSVIVPCPPKSQDIRGAVQYQVRVADACMYGIISNSIGNGGRHMFNTGHSNMKLDGTRNESRDFLFGINRFITVSNCYSKNTWHASFSTHNDAEYVTFENCKSVSSGFAGFNPRSNKCVVDNCKSYHSTIGVYLSDNIRNVVIKNNYVEGGEHGVYMYSNNELDFENIEITSNYLKSCTNGIYVYSNTSIEQTGRIYIDKNKLIDCGKSGSYAGIRVNMPNGRFVISVNNINECATTGIYLQSAIDVTLSENYVSFSNRTLLVGTVNYIFAINNNSFRCTTNGSWGEIYKATTYHSHNNTYTNSDATNFTKSDLGIRTGSTSSRPTTGLFAGLVYFDTSLNKLIIYNGSKWVNSNGEYV